MLLSHEPLAPEEALQVAVEETSQVFPKLSVAVALKVLVWPAVTEDVFGVTARFVAISWFTVKEAVSRRLLYVPETVQVPAFADVYTLFVHEPWALSVMLNVADAVMSQMFP